MLKTCVYLVAAMALCTAAVAQGQAADLSLPGLQPKSSKLTREQADQIIAQCQTRKFESVVTYEVDGHMRQTAVRMCPLVGQSNAAWIYQLETTAKAIETRPGLPETARAKLLADIQGEIARVKVLMPGKAADSGTMADKSAASGPIAKTAPAAFPPAIASLTARADPPAAPLPAADALVATVPAMPPPLAPRKDVPIGATPASTLIAPPLLSITCLEQGDRGEGSRCDMIGQGTVLAVKADADLGGPAILRFLRKGSDKGEIPIGPLKQGELVKVKLPTAVCSGVVHSELAIEIVAAGPVRGTTARGTATKGPYDLRC